jgi:hypothetical protein
LHEKKPPDEDVDWTSGNVLCLSGRHDTANANPFRPGYLPKPCFLQGPG